MPDLKVTSAHLERDAYLYIRQSTPRQIIENTQRAPCDSTHCASVRSLTAGRWNVFT